MAKYRITPSSKAIIQLPISIGHKAEKGVEAIEFDVTAWVETYGSGTLTVIMRRWGDAIPYPIALEIGEDNKATWTLSDIDTAKAGMAYAQLSYIVGDAVVKKSDIYTFRVMDSLTGEGEPPEAYESWLEHLTHLAAEAMAEVLDIEGIVTDKTLTVDGGIADAKVTGDALGALEDQFTEETDKLKADLGATNKALEAEPIIPIIWEQGRLSVSGALVRSDYAIRSKDFIPVDNNRRSISVLFGNYSLVSGSTSLGCIVFEYSATNPISLITYKSYNSGFTHTFAQSTTAFKITLAYVPTDTYLLTPDKGYLITPMWSNDGLTHKISSLIYAKNLTPYVSDDEIILGDVIEDGFYVIPSTATVTDGPEGVPVAALTVEHFSTLKATAFVKQTVESILYPSQYGVYHRFSNFNGEWTAWVRDTGVTNISNSYTNSYNITTTPTITTDTNGWLQAVDTDTADETGKTDMTGAIMSMLTATGYCHLGEGIFYVSGNIDMPERSTLCGCGNKTEIRLLQSTTTGYCVKLSEYSVVKDILFSGNRTPLTPETAGTRDAIHFTADYEGTPSVRTLRCVIDNVVIQEFSGSGIYCNETTMSPQEGLYVTNSYIRGCYIGINLQRYAEFNRFVNVCTSYCYYGVVNNGGNNAFTSCIFRANHIAFCVDGSFPNSAHGILDGCEFAHIGNNDGIAIKMENVNYAFTIANCMFGYCYSVFDNCSGINFTGCHFVSGAVPDNQTIIIDGGNTFMFTGCLFSVTPVITITDNTKVKFNACYEKNTGNPVTAT